MTKRTDGVSCGAILAADIVHLIKFGRLANEDDYTNADMPIPKIYATNSNTR